MNCLRNKQNPNCTITICWPIRFNSLKAMWGQGTAYFVPDIAIKTSISCRILIVRSRAARGTSMLRDATDEDGDARRGVFRRKAVVRSAASDPYFNIAMSS